MGMFNHVDVAACFGLPGPWTRMWQTKSVFPIDPRYMTNVRVNDFGELWYTDYHTRRAIRVQHSGTMEIHDFRNPHRMTGWLEYELHVVAGSLVRIVDAATNETFWERPPL